MTKQELRDKTKFLVDCAVKGDNPNVVTNEILSSVDLYVEELLGKNELMGPGQPRDNYIRNQFRLELRAKNKGEI